MMVRHPSDNRKAMAATSDFRSFKVFRTRTGIIMTMVAVRDVLL